MRASVTSFTEKFISTFFAATLALGFVPAAAFASPSSVGTEPAPSNEAVETEDAAQASGDDNPVVPAVNIINQEMPLEVVAQTEATTNYFLAQTLESTRTVPIVNASLPLDTNVGMEESEEGSTLPISSTVVGSFTSDGITYAVEPGGETVAVVAADYNQLPEQFIENQVIVIPSVATADSLDYYTVTRIADYAFANIHEGIEAIVIPASVTSIGDSAFAGCDTLQYLIVSDDNPNYSSYDGALYDADQTSLLLIPEGRLGAVRIAPSVTSIDPEVFSHCPSVDTLVADPDSAAYQLLEENDEVRANEIDLTYDKSKESTFSSFMSEREDAISKIVLMFDKPVEEKKAVLSERVTAAAALKAPTGWSYVATVNAPIDSSVAFEPYQFSATGLITMSSLFSDEYHAAAALYLDHSEVAPNEPDSSTVFSADNACNVLSSFGYRGYSGARVGSKTKLACEIRYSPSIGLYLYTYSGPSSNNHTQHFPAVRVGDLAYPLQKCSTVTLFRRTAGAVDDQTAVSEWGFVPKGDGKLCYEYALIWGGGNQLSIDPNGGSYVGSQHVYSASSVGRFQPIASERDSHTFLGYTPSPESAVIPNEKPNAFDFYDVSTIYRVIDDVTLTAQWGSTATWNPVGGSFLTADAGTTLRPVGQSHVSPSASQCTRRGYTLVGWYDNAQYTGNGIAPGKETSALNENITYYAKWQANRYNVTFDAAASGNGSVTVNDFAEYDAPLPPLPSGASIASLPGNDFMGYYDDAGNKYYEANGSPVAGLTWDKDGDTTLYARLAANDYDVSFDANGGTGGQSANVTATFGEPMPAITATAPTRAGYTFQGWYDGTDYATATQYYTDKGASARTWNKAGAATLYAGWKANEYTVSFDANGGTGGQTATVTATYDSPLPDVISKTPPTRTGYTFDGWHDATSGGTCFYTAGGVPTANAWMTLGNGTLYAQWVLNMNTITLNPTAPAGESNPVTKGGMPFLATTTIADVDYFASLNKFDAQVPVIACAGYTFGGWMIDDGTNRVLFDKDGHGQGTYGLDKDVVCVPVWTARTWTVKWDYNMPSTATAVTPATTTETFNTICKGVADPTCDGYTFAGWKRGGASIVPGTDLFRPTGADLNASEIVYTASWDAIQYEVTLLSGDHATYKYESSINKVDDSTYVYPYTVDKGRWMLKEPTADPGYANVYWEIEQADGTYVRYDKNYVSAEEFKKQGTDKLTFKAVQQAVASTITLAPGVGMPDEALADAPWTTQPYSLDKSVTLPSSLTYPGYTFKGWQLVEEDGTAMTGQPVLDPGTVISAPANQNPLPRVYAAVWDKDAYTVKFLYSEVEPYEVAPSVTGVAYDEEFEVPYANFRNAFANGMVAGELVKDTTARILRYYEAHEGTGTSKAYLQGQTLTVKDILEAYPAKKAATASGAYEIELYGSWTTAYHVDVPLTVNVAFDPERPKDSMVAGDGFLRFTQAYATIPQVDVVGLICEPVGSDGKGPGTEGAFDDDPSFLSGTYLTLSAKKAAMPVEFNLGSVTSAGTSGLPLSGTTTSGTYTLLPDMGFTFGGTERTLDLEFGLRFDSRVDTSKLGYLKDSGVINTGKKVPIARIYYTLALQSASV